MKSSTARSIRTSTISILALAAALFSQNSGALDPVRLPNHTTEVCIGKPTTIMTLDTQVEYWQVNGKTSGLSTFSVKSNHSSVTADYDRANLVATCRSPGTDTYDLIWKLAYKDMNYYSLQYIVKCVVCEPKKLIPVTPGFDPHPLPRKPVDDPGEGE